MADHYANAFTAQYGEEPNVAWLAAIEGLSAADLGTGINALKDRDESFPPNPGQFRAMCRPSDLAAQRRNAVGLPPPRSERPLSPAEAAPYIQRMKDILRGNHAAS